MRVDVVAHLERARRRKVEPTAQLAGDVCADPVGERLGRVDDPADPGVDDPRGPDPDPDGVGRVQLADELGDLVEDGGRADAGRGRRGDDVADGAIRPHAGCSGLGPAEVDTDRVRHCSLTPVGFVD
nr:hypothetical protein [Tessaracoccus defluvii]